MHLRNINTFYFLFFSLLFTFICLFFATTGENVMSTFPTEASINLVAATDNQLQVNSSDLRSAVAFSESVSMCLDWSLPNQRRVER